MVGLVAAVVEEYYLSTIDVNAGSPFPKVILGKKRLELYNHLHQEPKKSRSQDLLCALYCKL